MTRAIAPALALLILIGTVAIAGCGGGCPNCGVIVPVRADITAGQLQIMLDDGKPLQLLDVRTAAEFATGIIPGAINIPVEDIKGPTEELAALGRTVRTVVYCRTGARSVTAATALLEMDFGDVLNLLGGIEAWTGETELPDCGCG
jgi:rhodanese-related sulfurtransferase